MRLIVEGNDVDLVPGQIIELTRSNAQVAQLGETSGSFSNDFNAALTANNISSIDIRIVIIFFLFKKMPHIPTVKRTAPTTR